MQALVTIYNSIELYPPTLNAIELMQSEFDGIQIICIDNYSGPTTKFNDNVSLINLHFNNESIVSRINSFARYIRAIRRSIRNDSPDLILVYDAEAAFALSIALIGVSKKTTIWYHVHDSIDKKYMKKYTLNHLSIISQNKLFKNISFFTLPASERVETYKSFQYNCACYIIPNYPLLEVYKKVQAQSPTNEVILVYQGRVVAKRGIEQILKVLSKNKLLLPIKLHLIGKIDDNFKLELYNLINNLGISSSVFIFGTVPHRKLHAYTSKGHIGLAIYTADDNIHTTLGTASNKAYEYTACGMPFLYFNNEHFSKYFKRMRWALPVNLDEDSIENAILFAIGDYLRLSNEAKEYFTNNANYEAVFSPFLELVKLRLNK